VIYQQHHKCAKKGEGGVIDIEAHDGRGCYAGEMRCENGVMRALDGKRERTNIRWYTQRWSSILWSILRHPTRAETGPKVNRKDRPAGEGLKHAPCA
jgi:hypothetical protein